MREHIKLSLFALMQILAIRLTPAIASSICSNSFRFDQLCPDPRFGSRESSVSTNFSPDTNIQLNNNSNNRRVYTGHGGRSSNGGGGSYTSSLLLKDPSTFSCDFVLNGVETAVVSGVHVTENPWDFRHANMCNHIVKISYDLFDGGQLEGSVSNVKSSSTRVKKSKDKVCANEIGIRRHTANDDITAPNYHDLGNEEELAKKMNVYFWHNFTLYPHSAEFTDTITNFHLSRDDIGCIPGPKHGQYVQIAIVVSKGGRCEIILQQYKIELNRSPFGCSAPGYPIPYPIQFCGSYECAQSNSILTGLKLMSRRMEGSKDDLHQSRPYPEVHIKTKGPSPHQQHHFDYSEETDSKRNEHLNYEESTTTSPCTTTMSDEENEENAVPKRMEWQEAVFVYTFPTMGILFILIVLNILRTRSGREICRGYSYSYPGPDMYRGSCNSIEKNSLP